VTIHSRRRQRLRHNYLKTNSRLKTFSRLLLLLPLLLRPSSLLLHFAAIKLHRAPFLLSILLQSLILHGLLCDRLVIVSLCLSGSLHHVSHCHCRIVLDGHNYSEWAFYVQTALQGNGLLFHLTDDPPALLTDHRYQNMADQWWQGDGCYGQ
jgi:hypothetical protein